MIQYVRNNEFQISSIVTPQETLTFTYDASNNDSVRVTNQGNTVGGDLYGSRGRWRNSVTGITNFSGVSTDDATGTAQFNYDFRGYPITETLILSGRGGSTTFPISKIIDNDGIPQQIGALVMSRDAASGRLTGTQLDAVSTVHTYNNFGEISGVTYSVGGSAIYSESYQRDTGGRITARTVASDGSTTNYGYQYDSGARLWRVLENGSLAAEYLYSPNGRRSGGNIRGQSVNASYDVQDRLTNYNGTNYTYNPNGELTFRQASTGSTRQYLWNNRGQLTGVNIGPQNIRYIVDGFGRRIGKRSAGTMNRSWSYRNDLQISGEFDDTNTRKWFFIYGSLPHVPDYMIHAITQERYRLIHDHVGSVVMVVNSATGAIAQSLKYDEFGRVLTDSNPGFQPFGFAGGLYDHDTGLVRFGARDYDAEIGRWITKDPILFNGGDTNLYGYVGGDPINFIDPSGLWSLTFGVFGGYGGSITIGRSASGSYFGTIRAGVGLGAGASYDPRGEPPPGPQCRGGVSIGQYAEAGVNLGPLEANAGLSSGFSQSSGPYSNPVGVTGGLTNTTGVGIGVSAGLEISFW